ncbi:MAG: DUF3662 and FHA domain-containing protein [Desulfotomaculaceae bacterium]|nr:DUF3662 and FHA domain-containing protein [Desulfotomaculaceae bacterium]
MGMFSGLEGSLEKYIEGFFKDKISGRVQPADIAKKLAREMRDCKRVSVSNIYVPNEYIVFLHHSDWESIFAFSGALANELQDYICHKAAEKKYSLAGRPLVKFVSDGNIAAGSIIVESRFSETPPEEENTAVECEPLEHTQRFTPVKDKPSLDGPPLVYAKLRVESGPERDKTFTLNKVSMVIGRRDDCDIVLSDDSISRSHARLDLHQSVYTIHDLGSTNGIKVNGDKITARVLKSGDVITLGATVCTFKVE